MSNNTHVKTSKGFHDDKKSTAIEKMNSWVRETKEIPSQPRLMLNILRMTDDVNTFSSDLVQALAEDKNLASKIVELSKKRERNGSRFISDIRTSDIKKSIQRLGYVLVQNEVEIDFAKRYAKPIKKIQNLNLTRLLKHSLKCAVIGKEIANLIGYENHELAFFAGLEQHIGRIVIGIRDTEAFEKTCELIDQGYTSREAEMSTLGFSSDALRERLLKHWDMPETLINIEEHPRLNLILKFSNFITRSLEDKNSSPRQMWLRAQDYLNDLEVDMKMDQWVDGINTLFIKILEFEDRIFIQEN